ncbi:hypothetical protein SAMN02787142_7926 [Burkholderia sp. WP9]|nr:hypothetical protein SAMN02787142_7926 [Burkholderia sp. WP9]
MCRGERAIPGAGVTDRFFDCQGALPLLRGAHLLRQTRVQVLNDDLLKIVGRFPGMSAEEPAALKEAAWRLLTNSEWRALPTLTNASGGWVPG